MKDIFRTLPVIAVMTTVAACSGGIEEQNPNGPATGDKILSLIHISEPTRRS